MLSKILAKNSSVCVSDNAECFHSRDLPKRTAYNNAYESVRIKEIVLKERALRITSKSPALYTEEARQNQTTGVVRLKVTFLASGEIGDISVINGLPDGLTEQAVIAAKRIKFEPVMFGEKPITVVKTIEYSFSIYEEGEL